MTSPQLLEQLAPAFRPARATLATRGTASGAIMGRIKKPSGKQIRGIWVFAFSARGRPLQGREVARARSDSHGRYKLLGLPSGRYRVLANGYPKLRESLWRGGATAWRKAQKIRLRKGRTVRGKGIRLAKLPVAPPPPVVPTRRTRSPSVVRGIPVDAIQPYEGQTECLPDPQPGTLGLRDLIIQTHGTDDAIGLNRECQPGVSEHYDGRAVDWMVDSRDLYTGSKGDAFVNWLTETRDG